MWGIAGHTLPAPGKAGRDPVYLTETPAGYVSPPSFVRQETALKLRRNGQRNNRQHRQRHRDIDFAMRGSWQIQ